MIKFFRKIRQRLLTENKFSKYMLYAIGEIILVVIGILIALQINNANENRKLDTQEQNYLIALQEEFRYNKEQLEKVVYKNNRYGDAALEILKHTGPDTPQITEEEFSKLFLRMINSEVQYRPSNGVLEEIISSGKLDIFKNQELKKHLSSWSGVLYKVRFQESELGTMRMQLIDLSQKNINTKKLFLQSFDNFMEVTPTKFTTSNVNLLQLEEFENQTMAFFATSRYSNLNYYADLGEKIDAILQLIKSEIQ